MYLDIFIKRMLTNNDDRSYEGRGPVEGLTRALDGAQCLRFNSFSSSAVFILRPS